MSPRPLNEEELASLREIHQSILSSEAPETLLADGRTLADYFRGQLPDLDDVTLGRVILNVAAFIGSVADHTLCGTVSTVSAQLTASGLDLTSLEWRQA